MLAGATLALSAASLALLVLVYREMKRCRQIVAAYNSKRILEELEACCKRLEKLITLSDKGIMNKTKRDNKTSIDESSKKSSVRMVLDLNDPAVRQVFEYYLRVHGRGER